MTTAIVSQSAAKVPTYVGAIGDRVRVDGFVKILFSGMAIVEDTDGNEFEVRTRKPIARRKNALVSIEGTVAAHIDFRGTKRNVLEGIRESVVTDAHPMA